MPVGTSFDATPPRKGRSALGQLLAMWGALPRVVRRFATDFAAVPARAWIGLAWLGVVTSTAMMFLWNALLRHLEPVQVAICANAQPAATAALAAALAAVGLLEGDQRLGWVFWTGTALVVGGVAVVQRRG